MISLLVELTQKGGPVMWPIYITFLVSLFFMIERAWALAGFNAIEKEFYRALHAPDASAVETFKLFADRFGPAGIMSQKGGAEQILSELANEIENELGRFLTSLSIVYKSAPLLGLLGTVLGMIKVFREMAGAGLSQTQYFAGGISEALITTAAGLVVAIPSLVFSFYLNALVTRKVGQYEALYLSTVKR